MELSPIGEAVLIAREGRRLKAYKDSVGVWTIGIGVTTIDGKPVTAGMTITSAQCDALFDVTVARYVSAVNKGLKVPVSQNVFDALVSVCYNIGIGAAAPRSGFLGSTFLNRINAGDMAGARDAILMWNKPAAIIARRQAEAEQFVTSYAQSLPRQTSGSKPIKVAAPVIEVLHPEVPTPVIAPVTVEAKPNVWMRLMRWVDDTWGDRPAARAA
ncbi:lysozyme [Methylobacterium segetis]|uniref:lysozyme n=1 Tax=Methylobacterium segetis TaxID=2488750 RepID=UPI00104F7496|nr:lysozyme [Methylobacterium segetis]